MPEGSYSVPARPGRARTSGNPGARWLFRAYGPGMGVFALDVDANTLRRRLDERREDELGSKSAERDFILALHAAGFAPQMAMTAPQPVQWLVRPR